MKKFIYLLVALMIACTIEAGAQARRKGVGKAPATAGKVDPAVFTRIWSDDGSTMFQLVPKGVCNNSGEFESYGDITVVLPDWKTDKNIITKYSVKGDTLYMDFECWNTWENGKAEAIYNPKDNTLTLKITHPIKGCALKDCVMKSE